MHEIDAWVDSLKGPAAPEHPPDVRRWARTQRRRWIVGSTVGLALAAALLLVLRQGPADTGLRGISGSSPPVHLRVAIEGAGGAERVRHGGTYEVGQIAWFRVEADQPAPVAVWVEGPEGRQILTQGIRTDAAGRDLSSGEGFVVYEMAEAGRYTFFASAEGLGACADDSCDRVSVEVR